MSKIIFCCCLALSLFACGETDTNVNASDVPATIMTAFNAEYPGATDVEWEKDDDSYEVEFKMNGEEMEVDYDMNGQMIED